MNPLTNPFQPETQTQPTTLKPRESLRRAEGALSSQLSQIQNQMSEIQKRRQELATQKEEQEKKGKFNVFIGELQDAAAQIGGNQSQKGLEAQLREDQQRQQIQSELGLLGQEESQLQQQKFGVEGAEINLLERKEAEDQQFQQLQQQAEIQRQANDPNSQLSKQKRQELAFLGINVPENLSATQIDSNRDMLLKAEERRQQRDFELMKHQRDLEIQALKEERDLQKQLFLSDRKDATTLAQAQKRRSEATMEAYYNAKDAIDLVNRGGNSRNPNQASDQALLEGYRRLLKNQATSYDDEGRPIVNKGLIDQANSQINVWKERLAGNKGLLTADDRRSLVAEAKNLYEIDQGSNVKKLSNIMSWSNEMAKKNPNIDAGFILPGIDQDVLQQELLEFFPEQGRDVYATTAQKLGFGQPTTTQTPTTMTAGEPNRIPYSPGQGTSMSGRKVMVFNDNED